MQIFINSEYMDENKALISPFSAGFMHGYGVFETIKVYGKKLIFIQEHVQRLNDSLDLLYLELNYNIDELIDICAKLINENSVTNGFVKIMCSKGAAGKTDVIIYTGNKNYENKYQTGFKICAANPKRNEHSELCYIKSMNYFENIIQKETAKKYGYDEAIFLNTRNHVSEGCISNIFWVKEKRVFTPAVQCGILPGIARQKTIELCKEIGIPVVTGEFCLDELKNADEIFVTNSLMDIMPVCIFGNRTFDIKKYHLTNDLMQKYKMRYMNLD